ncbi:MAG: leucine--tRNA ligase [bacterium]
MEKYDHKKIELKWKKKWEKSKLYKISGKQDKPKYYVLDMFPYPSGEGLHVGHPKGYIATDILARMKTMRGYNVLHPMGWDAFGLPAENYAIKNKVHPREATEKNIKTFKAQLGKLGFFYDWEREINTTDPEYYKWTQWAFLQMFKKGLAYESREPINWCPSCKTGLANEDLENGKCERCGSDIERKPMRQWVLKITDYADRLLADLDKLPGWEESIKEMQRNWIGRSEGAVVKFSISNDEIDYLEVYTTRPDTLFGCTYMVVCPEHKLIANHKEKIDNYNEVEKYIDKSKKKSDLERTDLAKEKTGVKIEGLAAINPANNEEIPIFVADYVLAGYGTGAIMAVPAHDERDWEFAKKYNLPIRRVVKSDKDLPYCEEGVNINSGFLDGLETKQAKAKIIEWLEEKKIGKKAVNYKLKDWVFSRQRYWGEPIPIVHCEKCGAVAVPEKDLPVKLPEVKNYEPSGTGESPLANIAKWVNTKCPKCVGPAKRETNTMPQWAGSSWYYLRYIDPKNRKALVDKTKEKYWSPVDFYVGGAEHATRHLIYARFWHKFLHDIGAVNYEEPFTRLRHVGLILAEDGRKMSKRWGNVINPDEIVEKYGADAMRVYEMFMGPFSQPCAWNTNGLIGARRFLENVYKIKPKICSSTGGRRLENLLHKTIKKVSEDIEDFKFNTAISQMMIFANESEKEISKSDFENFLIILSPFAPHLCEELWSELGNKESIFKQKWPECDKNLIKDETINLVVQVNGKLRDNLEVSADISEEEAKKNAMESEKIKKWIDGKEILKVIFVKGRLVNIVLR